jgi:hypothetical protein
MVAGWGPRCRRAADAKMGAVPAQLLMTSCDESKSRSVDEVCYGALMHPHLTPYPLPLSETIQQFH